MNASYITSLWIICSSYSSFFVILIKISHVNHSQEGSCAASKRGGWWLSYFFILNKGLLMNLSVSCLEIESPRPSCKWKTEFYLLMSGLVFWKIEFYTLKFRKIGCYRAFQAIIFDFLLLVHLPCVLQA